MIRLISFFLFISLTTFNQTIFIAKVIGIKDGDTVVVLDSLNNQTTLRIAEVAFQQKSQLN
mgnify:CR=1 FL=1